MDGVYYGIIPLSGQFEQLLFIKNPDGTTSFAFADELIAHYAASIFNKSTLAERLSVPRDPQCGYHGGRGHDGS